jgi:hypothetical protein
MKSLASWSPDYLKVLYTLEVGKLNQKFLTDKQREVQTKKVDAVYRLGTTPIMEKVWGKLLAKDADFIKNPLEQEQALVSGILENIWLNPFGADQDTPEENTKELNKIIKKIEDLKEAIAKSSYASYWDDLAVETLLHKKNVDYRNAKGEVIGSQFLNYLKFIDTNADDELSQLPLDEHMDWKQRTQAQRLGWWTREALHLNLIEILDFYSELMMDSSVIYKKHYQRDKPKLIRGLHRLMIELYGSPLDAYVADIASVILEDYYLNRDNVKSYR